MEEELDLSGDSDGENGISDSLNRGDEGTRKSLKKGEKKQIEDKLGAGESPADVAADFGLPVNKVEKIASQLKGKSSGEASWTPKPKKTGSKRGPKKNAGPDRQQILEKLVRFSDAEGIPIRDIRSTLEHVLGE